MGGTAERYTTRDAAKITGLSPARIRYYVRGGLVAAAGDKAGPYRYSFHDLLLLKTTKRLREAGVSLQQIRRAFASLNDGDAKNAPLTRLAIAADGDRVVVARGGARWRPESGQLVLRFEGCGPGAAAVESLMPQGSTGPLTGHEWYDVGVEQEAVSIDDAMEAYRRALQREPDLVEAHINLGRLLHITGRVEIARVHYARAMQLDPLDPIPVFNLGVVLEDLGRPDEALGMYRNAIRRDPRLADAHYNLALLYERQGRRADALRHLRAYRRLAEGETGEPE